MTTAADRSEENRQLARLIASGMTYAEAGAVIGLTEQTVYRRMRDSAMRATVAAERSLIVDLIVNRLAGLGDDAVSLLGHVIRDDTAPIVERRRAAGAVLDNLARWSHAGSTPPPYPQSVAELDAQLVGQLTGGMPSWTDDLDEP